MTTIKYPTSQRNGITIEWAWCNECEGVIWRPVNSPDWRLAGQSEFTQSGLTLEDLPNLDTCCSEVRSRIIETAVDYINELCTNSPLERDDVLNAQRDLYRKNADHLSDCFADTREWAEDEDFTQAEMEAEIVRQIMDGHAW